MRRTLSISNQNIRDYVEKLEDKPNVGRPHGDLMGWNSDIPVREPTDPYSTVGLSRVRIQAMSRGILSGCYDNAALMVAIDSLRRPEYPIRPIVRFRIGQNLIDMRNFFPHVSLGNPGHQEVLAMSRPVTIRESSNERSSETSNLEAGVFWMGAIHTGHVSSEAESWWLGLKPYVLDANYHTDRHDCQAYHPHVDTCLPSQFGSFCAGGARLDIMRWLNQGNWHRAFLKFQEHLELYTPGDAYHTLEGFRYGICVNCGNLLREGPLCANCNVRCHVCNNVRPKWAFRECDTCSKIETIAICCNPRDICRLCGYYICSLCLTNCDGPCNRCSNQMTLELGELYEFRITEEIASGSGSVSVEPADVLVSPPETTGSVRDGADRIAMPPCPF